jgi:site-specific DNA-cytosine methylase
MAIRTAQTGSNGWGIGTDEQAYTLDGAQGQAVLAGTLQAEMYHHGGIPNQTTNSDNGMPQPSSAGVRRLTPLECERLMGWPDDHTRWTADGREIADSHRYRMCGNGVVAPVAEWIGHRLVAVDAALHPQPISKF